VICSAAENWESLLISFGLLTGATAPNKVALRAEKAPGTRPRFRLLSIILCALAFKHIPRRFIPHHGSLGRIVRIRAHARPE
jgi:hypothetical protein